MGDLLYGIHPLCEAFVAGRRGLKKLYVSKSRKVKGVKALLDRARALEIPIQYKTPEYFQSRFGKSVHQGVAAQVGDFPVADEKSQPVVKSRQAAEISSVRLVPRTAGELP